jgi:hypothetical protein
MVLIVPLCVTLIAAFLGPRSVCNFSERQMSELEQRAVIKFLWKEGCAAKKLHERLQAVYANAADALPSIYFWVKEFKGIPKEIVDQTPP